MCLWIKTKKMLVAEEDIVCYKTLSKTNDGGYCTSYTNTYVPESVINGSDLFKAEGPLKLEKNERCKNSTRYKYSTEGGLIHSYACKEDPFETNKKYNFDDTIFECVIPKGTKYYVGLFDGNSESYASQCIRFVKKIWEPSF